METANLNCNEETRPEVAKQSGRRKSKQNEAQKKKVPQRGMGVERLEAELIKMEETRRKTRISENLQNHLFVTPTFPDPSIQQHLSKLGSYGASQTGLNQALMLQRLGTGGFQVDPYGFKASNPSYHVGSVIETNPRELCKIPSLKCYSEQCCVCHKKKRIIGGSLICNGDRKMSPETNQTNSYNFAGFNVRRENHDLVRNQEAGVVAVHRKGNLVGGGDSLVMEYEFFPGGQGNKEMMKMGVSESSSSGEGYYYNNNNNSVPKTGTCVDLDLKLSY